MTGETNLTILIKNMQPIANKGQYVFCSVPNATALDFKEIQLFFKEKEGITIIVEKSYADKQGFAYPSVCTWISLLIHSAIEAVGLTAAFSNALAKENIPCNVVAGYYHDHIFVPIEMAVKALKTLKKLSKTYKNNENK